ncbi:MAG: NUDIX domain-containing protein [Tenericutes bacterium]|nr:NUDIX domain-containing protein [Mycoplasmatota bacterium]
MKKEKSCGCIVVRNNSEVLLVKMNAGHWSFPKGHFELGESEGETALRETFEETSIKCNIVKGFREVSTYSPYKGVIKEVVFFIARPVNGIISIQEEEIEESDFFDFKTAKKLITYSNDLEIFDKAIMFVESQ